jgi:pyroglutamyl-peptidase
MKALITGFEAFNGSSINPTAMLVDAIQEKKIKLPDELELKAIKLPVTFADAFTVLAEGISSFAPDVILSFGQAGGRACIEFERVAINVIDAEIPDNHGHSPRDLPIEEGAPAAIFSTLPIKPLIEHLSLNGIESRISNSAGTYVCNYLFYRLMRATAGTHQLAGFIHVPWHPDQHRPGPTLSTEALLQAVEGMLSYLILNQGDKSAKPS